MAYRLASRPVRAATLLAVLMGLAACSGPAAKPAADADTDAGSIQALDTPGGTDAPDSTADAPTCGVACTAQAAQACQAWTCAGGTCLAIALADGSACDDGDPCSSPDGCLAGACLPGPVTVCADDGNPCTVSACVAATGQCATTPVTTTVPCDDGNALTTPDTCCTAGSADCKPGSCRPGKSIGDCLGTDPDECEWLEGDANFCNGTLTCQVSTHTCVLVPGSVVQCDPANDSDCLHAVCEPTSGQCVAKPWHEAQACDTGNSACIQAECEKGQCVVTTKLCACADNSDCASKNSADLCTGTYYCDKSQPGAWTCKLNPTTVVACPHGGDSACAKNACNPATGLCAQAAVEHVDCTFTGGGCKLTGKTNPPTACDDGNACSTLDKCQGGGCVGGGSNVCACQADADCAAKDDGNLCNGTLFCNQVSGLCQLNPATVVSCPSANDTACLTMQCKTVLDGQGLPLAATCVQVPAPQATSCSDGDPCTAGDSCQDGTCQASANVCACNQDADCLKVDDGNACNGTLMCDKTGLPWSCKLNPASLVVCPAVDDSECASNVCNPLNGQCEIKAGAKGTPCDADGNPCTQGDACSDGACQPGGNACECQKDTDCAKFEDSNACNGTLYCDKAAAKPTCTVNPATLVTCPTAGDSECSHNQCNPATGQCQVLAIHDGLGCDADGNPCTATDTCIAGQCLAGTNVCGCVTSGDCKAKDDSNPCNGKLFCDGATHQCLTVPGSAVTCAASTPACQASACDPATGACTLVQLADSAPCSDGSPCTFGDTCKAGQCQPGTDLCACKTANDCMDDGDVCNGGVACVGGACQHDAKTAVTCAAAGCTGACDKLTGQCTAPVPGGCDDGNPCTSDLCDKSAKCLHQTLADGNVCGVGHVCAASQCVAVPAGMTIVSGTFWMGCNTTVDGQCQGDEKPQHLVAVSPVLVDRYEATVAAYEQCVKSGACTASAAGDGHCNAGQPFRDGHPINCITWNQADSFCKHAGKRLPTEAEWELAARGGCKSATCKQDAPRWPWGSMPVATCSLAALFGKLLPGCDLDATFPVGARPLDKSPWGIQDMAGNVSEWVADGYAADFYGSAQASLLDPQNTAPNLPRGTRGGSVAVGAAAARSSARAGQSAASSPWIGVRCAKSAP